MKNILLAAVFALFTLPAFAQNCIDRDGSPMPADTLVYKVMQGDYRFTLLTMPTAGKCHIEFESYDDRDEIETAIMDTTASIVGVKPKIKGDVEIFVLDQFNFNLFVARRRADALWSSHRLTDGIFDARLPAGQFYLVINNRHSPAKKSVTLTLGQGDAEPPSRPRNY